MCREDAAAGNEGQFDPFKRRDCRPKILWSVGQNSPTRAGAAAGGGVDGGEDTSKAAGGGENDIGKGGGAAGAARSTDGESASGNVGAGDPARTGLQNMHSFDGVDILEAGKVALEKKLGAVKTRAAPREGGKLTLNKYLEKARVDA